MTKDKRRQYGSGSVYQRKSDGRWMGVIQAGWTEKGTRRVITVSAATEVEAKRKVERKRRELDGSGQPAADARVTVKAWAEAWLEIHQRSARPKYYATDASIVRQWIIPTLGRKRIAALTPADVRAVVKAIEDAGRSTTTARYAQGVLKRMLRAAIVEEGARISEGVLLIPSPGKAVHDRDAIPTADARHLLNVARDRGESARWAAALLQGMRQGECLGLTWPAIDLDAGVIDVSWQLQALPYLDRAAGTFRIPDSYDVRHLHGAHHLVRPKSTKGTRTLPLVPWMTGQLTERRAAAPASSHGLVWPRDNGGPMTSTSDRTAWHALQEAAGVAHPAGRPYYLHEARHTCATLLLEEGVDPAVITAILGHSSIVTSRGYQHVSQALARKALEDVAARLGMGAPLQIEE